MRLRGSLKIEKDLTLPSPSDSVPALNLLAISDATGKVRWGNYVMPTVIPNKIYSYANTVVLGLDGKAYYSAIDNASGNDINNPAIWVPLSGGTILTQDQIDALNEANSPDASNPYATLDDIEALLTQDQLDALNGASGPSSSNPYATLSDIHNLTLVGTDTIDNILLKDFSVPNLLWISSTSGIDSSGDAVLAGDGIVSTGLGWNNIGPYRGPAGDSGTSGTSGTSGVASATFVYTQATVAGTWIVNHPKTGYPSVTVVNTLRDTVESTVNYVDENNIVITVIPATAGFAYINQ